MRGPKALLFGPLCRFDHSQDAGAERFWQCRPDVANALQDGVDFISAVLSTGGG
jgi:hypothetical protein